MLGENPCQSYSATIGLPCGFVASPSPSLEAFEDDDGDDGDGDDEDDASSSNDDEMTTSQ